MNPHIVLYGNQQKFNIEAVNDYPPIRFEIRIRIVADDLIQMEIFHSQVSNLHYMYLANGAFSVCCGLVCNCTCHVDE